MTEKKRSIGVYVAGIVIVMLSFLSCISIFTEAIFHGETPTLVRFAFNIIFGNFNQGLLPLSRIDPLSMILGPLGYAIVVLGVAIMPIFLIICGILLLKLKNWVRRFLLVYCWINAILLPIGYFMNKLFIAGGLQRLNTQTLSFMLKNPDFKIKYFNELSPMTDGITSFFLYRILPIILYIIFIYFFTRPKVRAQFSPERTE